MLAAVAAVIAILHQTPISVQATHLCAETGSPFGPYDMETYEAADYRNTYAHTLELAGFNQLFPKYPSFALPRLETGDRSAGSSQTTDPYIPPVLLKAIAWIESGWAQASYDPLVQYGEVGPTLISHDCGYGIMQITSGMQNVTGVPNLEQAMIGGHFAFNIARGAHILADKWNQAPEYRPVVGNRDPHIIENWYYALWSYNGFVFKNHPLNPIYDPARPQYSCGPDGDGFGHDRSQYPYQELVLGCAAHPAVRAGVALWPAQEVHLPELTDPQFAGPFNPQNWDPCSLSLVCAPMDIPTPNINHQDPTALGVTRPQVIGSPSLSVSTSNVGLVAPLGGQSQTVSVTISNAGSGVLAWRLSPTASWLRLSRVQGVSLGGDLGTVDQTVTIFADAGSLLPGTQSARVMLESLYGAGTPLSINVTLRIADGAIIQAPDGRVFVLQGGLRRYIPDPATFEAYGYSPASLIPVPDDWLATVPTGQPLPSILATGRLIRPPGDQVPVYVMDLGMKRHVSGPEVLSQCGYGWDSVRILTSSTIDSIPTGPPLVGTPCPRLYLPNGTLLSGSDGRVWVVQWNRRRWIVSPNTLADCGYSWGNLNNLGDSLNGLLATSPDLSGCSADGSLVWTEDGRVHMVRSGMLRYVPDPATFEANGFDWAQVAPLGATGFPAGEPLISAIETGRLVRPPGDQVPIYVMDAGAKRQIQDPNAFAGCGYGWGAVTVLSAGTIDSLPAGLPVQGPPCPRLVLTFGTLLQASDGAVWVTLGPIRKWVNSPAALASCGYQIANINSISLGLLAEIPAGELVNGCTADGSVLTTRDGRVYRVQSGVKRHVPNPPTFEALGLSWASVTPVPDGWLPTGKPLLDVAATGRLIRPPGNQVPVYVMDAGVKRHISSPAALASCGYGWDAITVLQDATVAGFPEGPPVSGQPCPQVVFQDGTLLTGSDGKVWAMQSGQRRWITNPVAFAACGYSWNDLNQVADTIINSFPPGTNLAGLPCP